LQVSIHQKVQARLSIALGSIRLLETACSSHTTGTSQYDVKHSQNSTEPSFNRQFAYQKPADAIRIIQGLPATSSTENDGVEFELSNTESGTQLILTDLEDATVRYTTRVTDTTKFSPLFVDALSWLLAAHLAGPVIKGDMGIAEAKRATQMYLLLLSEAKRSDANQRNAPPVHTPDWVSGRGQANPYLFDGKITR